MKHIGTQQFETERLICRKFNSNDYKNMFENWAANPNIQLEYGEPVYDTIQKVQELLKKYIDSYSNMDYYRWAIVEKASNQNIGQIAFCKVYSECRTAEIEYCIGEKFWENDYASEALSALIDFTFSHMDFVKLEAYHRIENIKSGKVLVKSKMEVTDTVERFIRENISPCGEVCYCITADMYKNL
jgi:ribosomal-protein-alanine N-acetyltransferase